MSLATIGNRITATLMSTTFLSTAHAMGWAGFFFMLCVVCIIVCAFMYKFLPETKGRSLEDMSFYFAEITGDNAVLEAETTVRQQQTQNIEKKKDEKYQSTNEVL
jgi:predicted MFS family arabinose efflux permease